MVNLKRLPGIPVAICVNDEPLTEYEDPTYIPTREDSRSFVAARQIMSTAGDKFSIRISLHPSFEMRTDGIWCDIHVDGLPVRGCLFRKLAFEERGKSLTSIVRGAREGSGAESVIRLFKFADVFTTDDIPADLQCMSGEDLKKSGIVIRVFDAGISLELPEIPASSNEDVLAVPKEKVVHETLAKGQAKLHTVGYGKIESAQAVPVAVLKPLYKEPFAIFRFQYRSKEALELIGTMKRTPTSEPSAILPEVKMEPMCTKQEKPDRAATAPAPATPSSRRGNASDLLNGMSPAEQIELYKTLQAKLNLGRKPAPAGTSPNKIQKKALTPANSPTKPRVKKTPKKKTSVSMPLRVIEENGRNVLDLTMED